uniref:Uncharacterized protein n=1 Tax=Picea sitchensis TaxID=3332 RepID=B8LN37_PICSI|nr:unknown [Picea sitchensis]
MKQARRVQRLTRSRGCLTRVLEWQWTWVAACMAHSSGKSTWLLSSTFVATCLTWSIEPSSWANIWTCSSMHFPMLQLSGNAPSARKHLPSWLGPRDRLARITGHQAPRFLCSLGF